jgi:hypothetical protein
VSVRGRPTLFTQDLATTICYRLAAGESLRAICRDEEMPCEAAVRAWVLDDREGFYAQYTRSREIQALSWADELLEISDDGTNDWMARKGEDGGVGWALNGEHIARSRLRTDTRKWLLSKMLPKVYGDRIATQQLDEHGNPAKAEQVFRWKREDEP